MKLEINSLKELVEFRDKLNKIIALSIELDLEVESSSIKSNGEESEKVYPIGKTSKGTDYDIDKKQIPENLINIVNYFKTIPSYLSCGWLFRFPNEEESENCAMLYYNNRGSVYYNVFNHTVYFGGFPATEEMLLNDMLRDLYNEIYK